MTKKLWFITGGKGAGKSTTVAYYPRPSQINRATVFDTEDSMSDILEQLKQKGKSFHQYIRAYDRLKDYLKIGDAQEYNTLLLERISQGKLPWRSEAEKHGLAEYWTWFTKRVTESLKDGKSRYLIIDTISPIEAGVTAWAKKYRKESGYINDVYAQGEVEAIRPLLENFIEGVHLAGVEHILITAHTKTPWVQYAPKKSKPVYDRVKPSGRLAVWSRLSTGMIWLVKPSFPSNAAGSPSAILMKARLGNTDIDKENDEWIPSNPMPPRIPAFTWSEFRRYQQEGWNPLNPKPGETVLPHEAEMMSELLSKKEYDLMIAHEQATLYENTGTKSLFGNESKGTIDVLTGQVKEPEEWIVQAKTMHDAGMNLLAIAKEVGKPKPIVKKELGL